MNMGYPFSLRSKDTMIEVNEYYRNEIDKLKEGCTKGNYK